jgi:hypothetical protein
MKQDSSRCGTAPLTPFTKTGIDWKADRLVEDHCLWRALPGGGAPPATRTMTAEERMGVIRR